MSKKNSLVFVFLFLLVLLNNIYSKELVYYKDVTGDGIEEKIYIKNLYLSNNSVKHGIADGTEIIILKDKKNIFPKEFNPKPWLGVPSRQPTSFMKCLGIDKFDNSFLGLQVLLTESCFLRNSNKYCKFGYFFKFDNNQNRFFYYKKDCLILNRGELLAEEEIIKKFKGKTSFAKSFENACYFLKLLQNNEFYRAKQICKHNCEIDFIEKNPDFIANFSLDTRRSDITNQGHYVFFDSKTQKHKTGDYGMGIGIEVDSCNNNIYYFYIFCGRKPIYDN